MGFGKAVKHLRCSHFVVFCAGLALGYILLDTGQQRNRVKMMSAVERNSFTCDNHIRSFGDMVDTNPRDVTLVLIVAYMRSGSTFVSQLINVNPNGFFVFEPLHNVDYAPAHALIKYLNGSFLTQPVMASKHVMGLEALESFLTCEVQDIFYDVLVSGFMHNGRKTEQYRECGGVKTNSCLPLLKKLCQKSSLRGIKTVSLRLYDVRPLLDNLPNLKVLHIVRDPRAILHSRKTLDTISMYDGKILCKQMEADVVTFDLFGRLYPGRVKQVLYEDMAEDPTQMTTEIYEFLNMNVPTEVSEWVMKSTNGQGGGSEEFYSTWRKNSQVTASQWRKAILWSWTKYMDTYCQRLYPLLGYLPLPKYSLLRNMSHPSRIKL